MFFYKFVKKSIVKNQKLTHHKTYKKQFYHLNIFQKKIPIKTKFRIIGAADAAANLL